MILPALLSPMLAQIGFVNMTCTDVDTVVHRLLSSCTQVHPQRLWYRIRILCSA